MGYDCMKYDVYYVVPLFTPQNTKCLLDTQFSHVCKAASTLFPADKQTTREHSGRNGAQGQLYASSTHTTIYSLDSFLFEVKQQNIPRGMKYAPYKLARPAKYIYLNSHACATEWHHWWWWFSGR